MGCKPLWPYVTIYLVITNIYVHFFPLNAKDGDVYQYFREMLYKLSIMDKKQSVSCNNNVLRSKRQRLSISFLPEAE